MSATLARGSSIATWRITARRAWRHFSPSCPSQVRMPQLSCAGGAPACGNGVPFPPCSFPPESWQSRWMPAGELGNHLGARLSAAPLIRLVLNTAGLIRRAACGSMCRHAACCVLLVQTGLAHNLVLSQCLCAPASPGCPSASPHGAAQDFQLTG